MRTCDAASVCVTRYACGPDDGWEVVYDGCVPVDAACADGCPTCACMPNPCGDDLCFCVEEADGLGCGPSCPPGGCE